jgi:hypothetical protein
MVVVPEATVAANTQFQTGITASAYDPAENILFMADVATRQIQWTTVHYDSMFGRDLSTKRLEAEISSGLSEYSRLNPSK